MKARFLFALPVALLAPLAAGCSSSSSPETVGDGGTKDTGTTHPDTGMMTKPDTGMKPGKDSGTKDTGTPDTSMTTGMDASAGPVPAAGSVPISKGFIDVIGKTDDDYIIFQDSKGNTSASDIAGTVTQILAGSDSATAPGVFVVGKFVEIFENYTTKSVSGNTEYVSGDLYLWSHALGTPTLVAHDASPQTYISADSSLLMYMDAVQGTAGTYGNIGVVATNALAAGGTNLLTNVVVDLDSTTCLPFGEFDGQVLVVSTCANGDGGPGNPTVTAFNGASAWASTVLATNAGVSDLFATTGAAVNFATDTAGLNALTLNNATPGMLSIETLGAAGKTPLTSNYGVLTGGAASFYLSTTSSFALFTEASGVLGKATLATPADPTTATITAYAGADGGTNAIYGLGGVSPNEQYEIDYNTPLDSSIGAPASLFVRSIATGVGFQLVSNKVGFGFGGVNSWTADSAYVIFTDTLTSVPAVGGAAGSVGTLKSGNVTTGAVNELVADPHVWDSATLGGTNILYNQNYIPTTITLASGATLPNGAAAADLYVADASMASQGTIVQPGADATYYVTSDKTHVFYSITQFAIGDGGLLIPLANDGVYALTIPSP
jgi:hypothetical protein